MAISTPTRPTRTGGSERSPSVYAGATLGWGVLRHAARYLPSPADPSQPFILTDEQADIVLRWYAVDEDGEFIHRRGELEMAKGWGKSPLAALLSIEEFVGPVVFDHWDGPEPVGRSWDNPWIQIAAVSEDQTDNTYAAIFEMLSANDGRAAKSLGIDNGRTRLYLVGRPGRLEPVTAASGSREGQRLTFAVLDETHLWFRRNGGIKLAGTLRRNAAKMGGRTLETTNAPLIGEKSVAEQSGLAPGVMHYARRPLAEPDPSWPDARLLEALEAAYGDSYWVPRDRLIREMRDPATSWDDVLRFYFNLRAVGIGRAVDPRTWDRLAAPQEVKPGTLVGLGFDGSVSRDATALIACTRDGYSFPIDIWERPAGASEEWRIPRREVEAAVERAFATYRVGLMLVDPPRWATELEAWAERYQLGPRPEDQRVLAFETAQPRRMAPAVDRWLTAIREGTHHHDGDERLGRHVKGAHLRKVRIADDENDGRSRYVLVKGDERAWIDAAVADVLAFQAAMTMPDRPEQARKGGWAFVA